MLAKRRILIASLASIGVIAGAIVGYGIATLRLCPEQSQVKRASPVFRLCGLDREIIGSVPVETPLDEAVYSWRDTEGTKPTVRRLEYMSGQPAALIRGQLVSFLKSRHYARREPILGTEASFEWWTDGQNLFGFDLTNSDSTKTHVEVVFNAGLD